MNLKDSIRSIPGWPIAEVTFRDITTLMQDPVAYKEACDTFFNRYKDMKIDKVAGIEARGFILGGAIAEKMGLGFIPIRKKGKLPWETVSVTYNLEYGTDELEVHVDAIAKGENILIVDDLLATGGTLTAGAQLVEKLGGKVASMGCIVELVDLKGREVLKKYDLFSILTYEGG